MYVAEILHVKGRTVHSIDVRAKVTEAIDRLVHHNVGSLLVCDMHSSSGHLSVTGILSERDVLRAMSSNPEGIAQLMVGDIMTNRLISVGPRDTVRHCMELMTEHRVRHLPVLDGDSLCGLVSIGDAVKAQVEDLVVENHNLHRYLQGESAMAVADCETDDPHRASREWLWLS